MVEPDSGLPIDEGWADTGLAQRIERALRNRIVFGELAGGHPLRQDHIAAAFGSSAIPVREALRRLEADGLVTFRPRRGAVVSTIDPFDALEVAEMRAALETLALRLAIADHRRRVVPAAHAAIAAADRSDALADWLAANRDFHMALYRPCGRSRLLSAISALWLTSDRHLCAVWSGLGYQARSQAEHRAILGAVEQGDAPRAEDLLRTHILAAGTALVAMLKAAVEPPPA